MTPALVYPYSPEDAVAHGPAAHGPVAHGQVAHGQVAHGLDAASRRPVREGILYANAEAAFARAGAVDFKGAFRGAAAAAKPGLLRVGSDERVLAVGLQAHLALADVRKCTLLAETLDPETLGGTEKPGKEAINTLLWSCLNTRRAVVVGRRAWGAAQLLPFADLRYHATPPLRFARAEAAPDRSRILIVNHERTTAAAEDLQASLASYASVTVMDGWTIDGRRPAEMADLEAGLHLHVGDHTLATDRLRIVDSWINRIPVLQVRSRRADAGRVSGDAVLQVNHAQNGFRCSGIADALAAYEDLRNDKVLRAKVTEAGARTAMPLAEAWRAIATELLDA